MEAKQKKQKETDRAQKAEAEQRRLETEVARLKDQLRSLQEEQAAGLFAPVQETKSPPVPAAPKPKQEKQAASSSVPIASQPAVRTSGGENFQKQQDTWLEISQ